MARKGKVISPAAIDQARGLRRNCPWLEYGARLSRAVADDTSVGKVDMVKFYDAAAVLTISNPTTLRAHGNCDCEAVIQ